MAKKSAKSKGYRRQSAKKPYLSKRDIALLCALIVAIAVGAFFLFRYDDGALKVQDGAVVTGGDNWLIANGSNTRGGARYYKLGEVGELDGYAREAKPMESDANLTEFVYTNGDAEALVKSVTVTTSHAAAKAMADYAATMIGGAANAEVGEVQTGEIGGATVSYFLYGAKPAEEAADTEEEAEAEAAPTGDAESSEAPYQRAVRAYLDADHGCCVVLRCEGGGDTADACPTDEQLLAELAKAIPVVTLEQSGK